MVEKSKKKSPSDAKCGKTREFTGDRLREPNQGTSVINNLRTTQPPQANWKVVVENFLECYHCAVSHPGFADLIDLDKYQVVPYERCSVQRGPLKASALAQRKDGFGAEAGGEGIYTYLWPNFMLNVYPGASNASTNLILPLA